MLCDDCWKAEAEYHVGHGVLLCGICVRHYSRASVLEKMTERAEMLDVLQRGGYLNYDKLKTIPLELLFPEEK